MKRFLAPAVCFLLLLCVSCGSAKPKPSGESRSSSESKATYKNLKLGLPSTVKGMVEQSTIFLTSDPAIVAMVEMEDLKEEVEARWDWISPNQKIYVSARRRVGPSAGKYYPRVALSHVMNVDSEKASTLPGLWSVEFSVDGVLKEAHRFPIEPGLATLHTKAVDVDPTKWALVVGIERYSQLPAVEFAAYDARTVVNYFVNLLGVPEGNVVLLENEKATRSVVTAKMKDYFPSNLTKDSTLYVYFAGHGIPDVKSGDPYLMLFDSDATNVARTGYPVKELLADLGAMKIKNAFLFTDACFSGMAARGDKLLVRGSRPAVIRVDDVTLAAGNIVAMGASTGNQLSHAYREKRHGLFTYYLLSGLKGEVEKHKDGGPVVLGDLYGYVKENVTQVSRKTTMEQTPTITPGIENVSDMPLAVVPKSAQ